MRKHEKELEEQLSAKAKELAEKENALRALTLETTMLKTRVQEQDARIASYQEREGALVAAMTQAEALSRNRLAETGTQVQTLLDNARREADALLSDAKAQAESTLHGAQQQASDTLAQAQREAADTLAQAKEQAVAMLTQAETSVSEQKSHTEAFNAQLAAAAKQAKAQLASLEAWMQRALVFADHEEQLGELQSMKEAVLAGEVQTPEAYANPAELMQSIYTIEGRELPKEPDEGMKPAADASAQASAEKTPAEEAPVAGAPAEEPPIAQLPAQEPETEQAPRMWTVDEIVASVIDGETPGPDADSDAYLKQLIDDILQ